MDSVALKRAVEGFIHEYKVNLKRCIEKGDQCLVCCDGGLSKEVGVLLRKGNAPKIHDLFKLETLTVIEKSIQLLPSKYGQLGLEKLSKAFEVLELAALNLYVYPWRREYRLVKMFSGMFTHLIKPALTHQQAMELFGLLGYEPSRVNKEELVLKPKPFPTDFLPTLACGFFAARIECQLLLSASGLENRNMEWVLQLVKERKAGQCLQEALDNTKRKCVAASTIKTGGLDCDIDLYTDQEPSPLCPPNVQSKETSQKRPLNSDMRDDSAFQRHFTNKIKPGPESVAEIQNQGDGLKRFTANSACKCLTPNTLYISHCSQCKDVHSLVCCYYGECCIKGHNFSFCQNKVEAAQDQSRPCKDSMKTHHCVDNSSPTSYLVCHNCQFIHDPNCSDVKLCTMKMHNVQPTGQLHLPQEEEERRKGAKQHTCMATSTSVYAFCNNCNYLHDFNCEHVQRCIDKAHALEYPSDKEPSGISYGPVTYHPRCYTGTKLPETVCYSCNVFHFPGCPDGMKCHQWHKCEVLNTKCMICTSSELFSLCKYCCAQYCRRCCFQNRTQCKCGKVLDCGSSV
ncbi:hypothetical protein DNTS_009273 [Danionella cerebrum]|uniref:Spermatogenesis-associated protein 2 PUB-like domain-containing protein n=1 Tax=Danionella cerebrum TaxID=2873325 RepID=A0A553Q5N2_9TELE|nr:hypothetical protein DNTS_009273 [Danionella translucida]